MPVSAIFENIEAGINHQMPSSNVLTKEHSMNADEKRSGGTKMTQCGWSEVGHDGGGVGGAKQVDAGVGVARGAERFRLAARVIGWAVGLWLFYFPGFVCGEAASPTPVASAATANPTPEGKISLEATARKRVPNKVADVVLAIQDVRIGSNKILEK